MDLRYDGSDGGTPDLELVDRTTAIGERHLGHLCQLVVWHGEDLVDDAERRRNDVVFAWPGRWCHLRYPNVPCCRGAVI